MVTHSPLDRSCSDLREFLFSATFSLNSAEGIVQNDNPHHTRLLIDSIFDEACPSTTKQNLLYNMTSHGYLHFQRLKGFECLLFNNPMRIVSFLNDDSMDTFSKTRLLFICCKSNNSLRYEVLSRARESICSNETLARFFILSMSQRIYSPELILFGEHGKPSHFSTVAAESLGNKCHPCYCKSFKELIQISKQYLPAIDMLISQSSEVTPYKMSLLQMHVPTLQTLISRQGPSTEQILTIGELILSLGHPAPHSPIQKILESLISTDPLEIYDTQHQTILRATHLLYMSGCRNKTVISILEHCFLERPLEDTRNKNTVNLLMARTSGESRFSPTPMTLIGFSYLERLLPKISMYFLELHTLRDILVSLSEADPERLKEILNGFLSKKEKFNNNEDEYKIQLLYEFSILLGDTGIISKLQKWLKEGNSIKKYYAVMALRKSQDETSRGLIKAIANSESAIKIPDLYDDLRKVALLSLIETLYASGDLDEIPSHCERFIKVLKGDEFELLDLLRKVGSIHSHSLISQISKSELMIRSLPSRALNTADNLDLTSILSNQQKLYIEAQKKAKALRIPRPHLYTEYTLDALVAIREGRPIDIERTTLWLTAIDDHNGALDYSDVIRKLIIEYDEPVLLYGFSSLKSFSRILDMVHQTYEGCFKRIVICSHSSPNHFEPVSRSDGYAQLLTAKDLSSIQSSIKARELLLFGCSTGQETLSSKNLLEASGEAFSLIDPGCIVGSKYFVSPADIGFVYTPLGSQFYSPNQYLFTSLKQYREEKNQNSC